MPNKNIKRLYRSKDNRMISGVCAGLAECVDVDPTIVRILFALGMVAGLSTLWIYLAMMLIVPEEP
jgi:phage shock protein PspC (stress-responsive transcriptional regulator)